MKFKRQIKHENYLLEELSADRKINTCYYSAIISTRCIFLVLSGADFLWLSFSFSIMGKNMVNFFRSNPNTQPLSPKPPLTKEIPYKIFWAKKQKKSLVQKAGKILYIFRGGGFTSLHPPGDDFLEVARWGEGGFLLC